MTFEPRSPLRVSFTPAVLAAIRFDDQPMFCASKVDNEAADWVLAAKFVSPQTAMA